MKLSLITINRNNVQGLEKTLRSVLSQTWRAFEYILVDGASEDGSVELVQQRLGLKKAGTFSKDGLSGHWLSEPDTGIYNAMNKGLGLASGAYCLFLNSGDCLAHENVLKEVWDRDPEADIVCGSSQGRLPSGQARRIPAPASFALRDILAGVPHQAEFIKTRCLRTYGGYDERFRLLADFDFNLGACLGGLSYKRMDLLVSTVDLTGRTADPAYARQMREENASIKRKHLPPRVWEDYAYFTDKKGLGNPALQGLIQKPRLFRMVKGLYYLFATR